MARVAVSPPPLPGPLPEPAQCPAELEVGLSELRPGSAAQRCHRDRTGERRAMTQPPKLSVTLSHIDSISGPGQADLLAMAAAADRAGVDQLVLSEHVTLPAVVNSHP